LYEFPSQDLTQTYFSFKAFNQLYKLGEAVEVKDARNENIFAIAAIDRKTGKKALMLTNYNHNEKYIKFDFEGKIKRVLVIDEKYKYSELNYFVPNSKAVRRMYPFKTLLIEAE
jgi:hypothetical protein